MGRDPGYMPEGTEDWMDGEPRAYDKPRRELSLTPPPPRPAEFKELAKAGLHEPGPREKPSGEDDRIKTIEATLTDLVRRLKALEERIIDPSA